jgi:hypothetical protein
MSPLIWGHGFHPVDTGLQVASGLGVDPVAGGDDPPVWGGHHQKSGFKGRFWWGVVEKILEHLGSHTHHALLLPQSKGLLQAAVFEPADQQVGDRGRHAPLKAAF